TNGSYHDVLVSSMGCDSTVHLQLAVTSVLETELMEQICEGESYSIGNQTYNQSGNYTKTLTATSGCDSIVHLALTVLTIHETNLTEQICEGESYLIDNQDYDQSGDYSVTLSSFAGCDSTVNLSLTVASVIETYITEQICEGESFVVNGEVFTETGEYQRPLTASSGCDSIVNLSLSLLPNVSVFLEAEICDGENYWIGTTSYQTEGTYEQTLLALNGCDSTVHLQLAVTSVLETELMEQICEGESYGIGNEVFTEAGNYQIDFSTPQGCDSIVNLSLSVLPNVSLFLEAEICDGESYWIGTTSYQTEGTYEQTLLTLNGCDSTVSLQLSVIDEASIGAAFAGEDQTTCLEDIQMQADLPPATSGYWTTTSSAILDDPASPNTFVYELAEGENTFTWTLSTTECVAYSSDAVVIELITTAPDAQDNDYTFSYPDGTLTGNLVINDILHASLEWVVEVINKPIIGTLDLSTDGQFTYELAGIAEQTVFEYEIYYQDCPQLRDTARVEIQITDLPSGEEVTGFSPDGDGVNDTYVIPEIEENPELYPDNEFIVFNRWGQIVYQESPYQNQWDGTLLDTGTPLPAGTYYYIIRLVLAGGKIPNISEKATIRDGQVTIFR
ncbi:MAG: gliding motility-associated C-terminal domain-containing protein, partial [Bacteroidetes bacterium]|nr:gliding motility-associated C-terminal domain-containing protein [Bacteroidota bacterium]